MGLDQHLYRINLIECPHCKNKIPVVDIERYNNDSDYRWNSEIEQCCYWRKNYELQEYMFKQGLYSDELYAKLSHPLTSENLREMLKYNGEHIDINIQMIKAAIVDTENEEAVYCYLADW